MSHRAVNWALEQTHLKPGPWIVLIKLADRHNKDSLLCCPQQRYLAADCNMSRATLNRHLDDLEAKGLFRRVERMDPRTRKQLSTQYILALDFDNPPMVEFAVSQIETRPEQEPSENIPDTRVSNCDTETVSQNSAIPCLKNGQSRVSNRDTNLVREPLREPVRDDDDAGERACADPVDQPSFRERLLDAMGVGPDGIAGPSKFIGGTADMAEAARWLDLPGLTPDMICTEIRAVMARKRDGPPSSFRYFTPSLRKLSGDLTAPALTPIEPTGPRTTGHGITVNFEEL